MGAPSLPPLHLLPGCGHLFLPPEMVHSGVSGLSLNEAGHLTRMGASAGQLGPLGHLGQMGQLGALGHLAALQIHACRSMPASVGFNAECNPGNIGSYGALRPLISPESDVSSLPISNQLRSSFASTSKRTRGEKRPIPDEHKDEKYYERRKRNNQAAKKSRDARKIREDQIALRAAILEHENNVLRAQLVTLREEVRALRRLLLGRSSPVMNNHCPAD